MYEARVVESSAIPSSGMRDGLMAIKAVPILPSGSAKLNDLKKELGIMRNVRQSYQMDMVRMSNMT